MNRSFLSISGILFFLVVACQTSKAPVTVTNPNSSGSKKDSAVQKVERKVYRNAYTMYNDLVHTKLEVKFDWTKKYLYGKATLTVQPHFYPTQSLVLNARGMTINEVSI